MTENKGSVSALLDVLKASGERKMMRATIQLYFKLNCFAKR